MKVVLLSEVFPPDVGGSGELLSNIYSRLADIDVTVVTETAAQSAPLSKEMRIIREAMKAPAWGLASRAGLSHHLRRAKRLRGLAPERTAVVHCARALPEGIDAWLNRTAGGSRYLCWAHGEDISTAYGSREFVWLMRRVYRGASAVVANSRNTASMVAACGVDPARVVVVYPGVDAQRFQAEPVSVNHLRGRLAPNGEALLLTVGRLQRRKGHDLMLRAVAELRSRHRPLRYVIVGDGAERGSLAKLTRDLGLGEIVQFEGVVAAADLPRYYAAADIFCHPNRIDGDDIEGFGMVFLEAAAAGVPVIGGRTGGVPEAVKDGVSGLLVSGTDISELVQALLTLMDDPAQAKVMGNAGRDRVIRSFSWERAAQAVADIHRQIADGRFPPSYVVSGVL